RAWAGRCISRRSTWRPLHFGKIIFGDRFDRDFFLAGSTAVVALLPVLHERACRSIDIDWIMPSAVAAAGRAGDDARAVIKADVEFVELRARQRHGAPSSRIAG